MAVTREQLEKWTPAIIIVVSCLAFAPGITSPLTRYDDWLYLTNNTIMRNPGWHGFLTVWDSGRAWRGEFPEFFPLRDSVYWLIFQRWELTGTPYHVVSLGFHICASLLALKFMRRLGASSTASMVGALIFAVHPIHIESVTWVSGLKDPMYTSLLLLSLLQYLKYREAPTPGRFAASLLLMVLALLVKSMAIATPLLLIGLERFVGRPTPWKEVLQRAAAFGAVCAAFTLEFVFIGKANGVLVPPHGGSWTAHAVLAAWAQVSYFKQAFAPTEFRLIYCFAPPESFADYRFMAAIGLALLTGLAVKHWWKTRPLLVLCVLWHFALLLPVSNIVPFTAVMADRYLYASSIGTCLMLAILLDDHLGRLKVPVVIGIVVVLALTTASRTFIWQNQEDLWAESDEDPDCMVDPDFPAADAHLLRAQTAADTSVALKALERTIATPAFANPRFIFQCEVLVERARIGVLRGESNHASVWVRTATKYCPNWTSAWNLALQLNMHRHLEAAADAARHQYDLTPNPLNRLARAVTMLELKVSPEQQQEAVDAVRSSPSTTCDALNTWLRAVSPELGQAVSEAKAICDGVPGGAPKP